ncbi:MAG: putative aliphatic sulfonates transport permease protein SsuC [Alphaproteobacteria bacterium MarineAlpha11_Bin1]|nr:MAG: putative aliphatic sulfonates transport permease protein SsuC [Alphaproteobacteria bacterium MarineAlpha11_Bin1]|tara:strand:- start:7830 stop:8600 length:771 start_codon:yes stop_codon:yes gene_type:complete
MTKAVFLRPLIVFVGLLIIWQFIVFLTDVPAYILPGPTNVAAAFEGRFDTLAVNAGVTLIEIVAGFAIGATIGMASALFMAYFRPARRWMMPVLVVSQTVPVFALAPILTLWLGYGIESKIAMAVLIIYFPVTAAFFDGLGRTNPGWVDIAHVMNASRWSQLRHIRIPAAMPSLGSGLRVAAAVAPIGAVVGEWVGSSAGLGYLMLHANARVQIDLMFAALFTLAAMGCIFYFAIDNIARRLAPWQIEITIERDER